MTPDYADKIRCRISNERGQKRSPPTDTNKAASLEKGSVCRKFNCQGVGKNDPGLKKPERHATAEGQECEKKDR